MVGPWATHGGHWTTHGRPIANQSVGVTWATHGQITKQTIVHPWATHGSPADRPLVTHESPWVPPMGAPWVVNGLTADELLITRGWRGSDPRAILG